MNPVTSLARDLAFPVRQDIAARDKESDTDFGKDIRWSVWPMECDQRLNTRHIGSGNMFTNAGVALGYGDMEEYLVGKAVVAQDSGDSVFPTRAETDTVNEIAPKAEWPVVDFRQQRTSAETDRDEEDDTEDGSGATAPNHFPPGLAG